MMLIPVILGVILLIFVVMDLAPGDPVLMVASPDATEEELEALRVELGLDKGLLHRYVPSLQKPVAESLRRPLSDWPPNREANE